MKLGRLANWENKMFTTFKFGLVKLHGGREHLPATAMVWEDTAAAGLLFVIIATIWKKNQLFILLNAFHSQPDSWEFPVQEISLARIFSARHPFLQQWGLEENCHNIPELCVTFSFNPILPQPGIELFLEHPGEYISQNNHIHEMEVYSSPTVQCLIFIMCKGYDSIQGLYIC